MQSLLERQLDLELEYSTASLVAGQEQILDAFRQGRATDVGSGRILLAKAYEGAVQKFTLYTQRKISGTGGKYKKLLTIASPEVLVMAGIRELINGCANPEPQNMQAVLQSIGRVIESESMLACMEQVNDRYTSRTVEYLDAAGTKSVHHRYRTFLAGARNMGMEWEQWSTEERVQTARLLCTELYESTGLFRWVTTQYSSGTSMYYLEPSDELSKHFHEVQSAAKAMVKYPPMLLKPEPWTGQFNGGYFTEWFRHHSPMCGLRYIQKEHRNWIIETLDSDVSLPVRSAMTKAQEVPYRVNKTVLQILRKATAMRVGILGLPSFIPLPQPVFPLGDNWQKSEATDSELEQFQFWKVQMAAWYTSENKRRGRNTGILSKLTELTRYADETELYFPTFIDWRGRMYFRSNLNPQSSDSVKGCIEFAEGKRLGEEGLKWLKVHVANCCGYDKHDPDIKAKWTDDNWVQILDFINNPLEVDAPEADTAFTLLQAGLALQEALELPDPTDYICHVPVAMDATMSGLQHLSAITRDPIGAYYTNLVNNNMNQKSDMYLHVASIADTTKLKYATRKVREDGKVVDVVHDTTLELFLKDLPISRALAKAPCMTYVYGSTLLSTIDRISLDLEEAGTPNITADDGTVLYSLSAIATPIGKALRKGVEDTVPEATIMMKYLQNLVRKHKEHCMQWVSPVGVPVVNWAEGAIVKRLHIRSMGVSSIQFTSRDNTYSTRIAANGVVPNFVHSMDAAHLCKTINDFDGSILPIHDSFATHPSDVPAMHTSLRSTFVELYSQYKIESFLEYNNISPEDFTPPEQGTLNINDVLSSPYMFG